VARPLVRTTVIANADMQTGCKCHRPHRKQLEVIPHTLHIIVYRLGYNARLHSQNPARSNDRYADVVLLPRWLDRHPDC